MIQSKPASSLSLEVILYFDQIYSVVYFVSAIGLYIYKGYKLTYPSNSIGPEVGALLLFLILHFFRLFIG